MGVWAWHIHIIHKLCSNVHHICTNMDIVHGACVSYRCSGQLIGHTVDFTHGITTRTCASLWQLLVVGRQTVILHLTDFNHICNGGFLVGCWLSTYRLQGTPLPLPSSSPCAYACIKHRTLHTQSARESGRKVPPLYHAMEHWGVTSLSVCMFTDHRRRGIVSSHSESHENCQLGTSDTTAPFYIS